MRIQPVPIVAVLLGSLFMFSCYSAIKEPPSATTVPTTAPKAPDDRAKTNPPKPAEQTQNPKSL